MPAISSIAESPALAPPRRRSGRIHWPFLALAVLCFVLFFFKLDERDLASSHEARAGQDAQCMLNSGQWDLPRLFDGRIEMQKPPLFYWVVALFGALNGGQVNAWSVRLPAALSALGCVLLLLGWGLRRGRPLAGYLAAVILATCLHFTTLARIGRIDMPLTFTVGLTVISFYEGRASPGRRESRRWYLLAYVATAIGVLLKGPIAVVLVCAVGMAIEIAKQIQSRYKNFEVKERPPPTGFDETANFKREWHDWGFGLLWGIPLVLLLTLPWYLWSIYQTDGEFFRVFFWHHNIDRGFGTDEALRAYPWWYYGPHLFLDLLPWSVLLPIAAWSAWRHGDEDARFGSLWFLAMLVLLSCMRFKRADYLLPAFPGAAWMLGCRLERWVRTMPLLRLRGAFAGVVMATTATWIGYLTVVVPQVEQTRSHRRFAEEVRRRTADPVLFFWAEAHLVAFHVGQPLTSFVEWDKLDSYAGLPQSSYVVMPVDCFTASPNFLKQGSLELVLRSANLAPSEEDRPALVRWANQLGMDNHERAYVLARTHCLPQPLSKAAP